MSLVIQWKHPFHWISLMTLRTDLLSLRSPGHTTTIGCRMRVKNRFPPWWDALAAGIGPCGPLGVNNKLDKRSLIHKNSNSLCVKTPRARPSDNRVYSSFSNFNVGLKVKRLSFFFFVFFFYLTAFPANLQVQTFIKQNRSTSFIWQGNHYFWVWI